MSAPGSLGEVVGLLQFKRTVRRSLGLIAPIAWRSKPKPSLVILTYHRVLPQGHPDRNIEQPGMWVSPETLAMHLKVLSKYFEFADLGSWLVQSESGDTLPDRSCAITFDDGWRDNYTHAFPLLRQAGIPATVFLVSEFIGGRYAFWPNRLARLCRRLGTTDLSSLPAPLEPMIRETVSSEHKWAMPMTVDQIDRLISACKTMPDAMLYELIDEAERVTGVDSLVSQRDLLDVDEIAEMHQSRLIQYGSHTRRHTRLLSGLSQNCLRDEVSGSKQQIETLLGQKVNLFCYPNGDYTEGAVDLVRRTYLGAVTTESGWNHLATDRYRLRRMTLHEGISADEQSLLCRVACLA
jgi:peptidoglycan/xylan/chitin deacetylase (PgdA/CDA1 family)